MKNFKIKKVKDKIQDQKWKVLAKIGLTRPKDSVENRRRLRDARQ